MRTLLLGAVASIALGTTANATTINGWYVSLEGGANWIEDWNHTQFSTTVGAVSDTDPAISSFDTGWAVLASVGYGWNHWRAEFEAGYRHNDQNAAIQFDPLPDQFTTNGDLSEITLMANVLYDIPLTERFGISLGAGAGADFVELDYQPAVGFPKDDNWSFAYQGIAGLNYAVGARTTLFLNYRYLRVTDPEFDFRPGVTQYLEGDDFVKHTATIGLRYAFGAPDAAPVAAPPPPAPPPPEAAAPREFIVFFGHNKSDLTGEALTVIKQAAAAAKEYGSATVTVTGHADRSGSNAHNQKLSLRRANVVKGALVNEGIAAGAITVSGRGEGEPLVPTADGAREPQNRRVHINL